VRRGELRADEGMARRGRKGWESVGRPALSQFTRKHDVSWPVRGTSWETSEVMNRAVSAGSEPMEDALMWGDQLEGGLRYARVAGEGRGWRCSGPAREATPRTDLRLAVHHVGSSVVAANCLGTVTVMASKSVCLERWC